MKTVLTKVCELLLLVSLLSACSPKPEDHFVELGRCYQAGLATDDAQMVQGVNLEIEKASREFNKTGMNPALFAMLVNEKVNDDLYPAGSSTDTDYVSKKVTQWASSSLCQGLKQPGIKVQEKPAMTTVPQINGSCSGIAEKITAAGLAPNEISIDGPVDADAAGIGCAYRQNPAAGTSVAAGSELRYRV